MGQVIFIAVLMHRLSDAVGMVAVGIMAPAPPVPPEIQAILGQRATPPRVCQEPFLAVPVEMEVRLVQVGREVIAAATAVILTFIVVAH